MLVSFVPDRDEAAMFEMVDLAEEGLLEEARLRTGLDDFGDASFRAGLAALLDLYDFPGGLTTNGKKAQRRRLLSLLETRLRVQDLLRRHPEVRERVLRRPIVLTGLPHTGTSTLFELLACDPTFRVLRASEGGRPDGAAADLRGAARATPPDDAPEECDCLLAHSFGFVQLGVEPMLSPYREYFAAEDRRPAYRYYADLLRLLDWQRPGERWLLRAPAHLWALEHVASIFPDASVVITHRSPLEWLPSYCQALLARLADYDAVDPESLGPVALDHVARAMDHAMDAREALPPSMFVDVQHAELVRDPLGVTRRLYVDLALPFTDEVRARVEAHVEASPPGREDGRLARSLERFGLTEAGVLDRLRRYVLRFDVPIA